MLLSGRFLHPTFTLLSFYIFSLAEAIQKQVENPRGLPKWLSHSNNILFLLQMARLIKKAIAQLPEGSDLETIFGRVAASAIRPQSDLQGYSSNPDAVRFDANEPGIIKSLLRDWEKEWNLMKQHQNVPRKKGKPDLVGAFGKRWENVVKAVMDDREALLRGDAGWFTANVSKMFSQIICSQKKYLYLAFAQSSNLVTGLADD